MIKKINDLPWAAVGAGHENEARADSRIANPICVHGPPRWHRERHKKIAYAEDAGTETTQSWICGRRRWRIRTEIKGIDDMTKASKAKMERVRTSARTVPQGGSAKRPGAARPTAMDSAGERRNRDDWVQMSFRAPAAVEEFVLTMCVKRKITFQTLILELLRALGAPISDADLLDNRRGRKSAHPGGAERQARKSASSGMCRDGIAALEQLRDPRLWEQIAQHGNGQRSTNVPLQVIFANFVGDKARWAK
jgi:hypothetical protein